MNHGNSGLHGSNDAMQLWRYAEQSGGFAHQPGACWWASSRHDRRQCPHREHPSVRYVQFSVESGCSRGNRSGSWRPHAHAVCSGHSRAMGARLANRSDWKHAGPHRSIKADVLVGRGNPDCQPRRIYGDGAVKIDISLNRTVNR
jgi:hypothetical protein